MEGGGQSSSHHIIHETKIKPAHIGHSLNSYYVWYLFICYYILYFFLFQIKNLCELMNYKLPNKIENHMEFRNGHRWEIFTLSNECSPLLDPTTHIPCTRHWHKRQGLTLCPCDSHCKPSLAHWNCGHAYTTIRQIKDPQHLSYIIQRLIKIADDMKTQIYDRKLY